MHVCVYVYNVCRLLTLLVKLKKATSILELGAFTGYSSVCLADGLCVEAESDAPRSSESKPRVTSCDSDARTLQIAIDSIKGSQYEDKVFNSIRS